MNAELCVGISSQQLVSWSSIHGMTLAIFGSPWHDIWMNRGTTYHLNMGWWLRDGTIMRGWWQHILANTALQSERLYPQFSVDAQILLLCHHTHTATITRLVCL
jgi:hypothetical protein